MPDDQAPVFVRFVSSVEGRLVGRWDATGACFGARVATREEREAGAEPMQWDTECVVPLTAAFCAKYDRELRNAVRGGDLLERKREDWEAWLRIEEQREAEHVKRLNEAASALAKVGDAVGVMPPGVPVVVEAPVEETTPPEAEPTQGRKKKP